MRYIFLVCSFFLIGFGGGFSTPYVWDKLFSLELHVFFESYATNPELSEMIEFAKLPKKTRKLIAWHRFPNRKHVINLAEYNAQEIDLPAEEGLVYSDTRRVIAAVQDTIDKKPNTRLILHLNLSHFAQMGVPFVQKFPNNIKHIHLYEDGYGELFKGENLVTGISTKIDLKEKAQLMLDKVKNEGFLSVFGLHHIYPTTYHLFAPKSWEHNKDYDDFRNAVKKKNIVRIDFDELAQTLTPEQKEIVYKLSGFDYQKWHNILNGKKSFCFVMGYHFGKDDLNQAELNAFTKFKEDFSPKHPDYIWLYKPHPSFSATMKVPPNELQGIIEIPAQIPYEVFILAGLKPTLTGGYSSSLFYSLHNKDIAFYIRRFSDSYLPFLKNYRHLPDNKILNLQNFIR